MQCTAFFHKNANCLSVFSAFILTTILIWVPFAFRAHTPIKHQQSIHHHALRWRWYSFRYRPCWSIWSLQITLSQKLWGNSRHCWAYCNQAFYSIGAVIACFGQLYVKTLPYSSCDAMLVMCWLMLLIRFDYLIISLLPVCSRVIMCTHANLIGGWPVLVVLAFFFLVHA